MGDPNRQPGDDGRFEADEFEESLRRAHPWLWWSTLVGPFVVTGVVVLVLWLLRGAAYVQLIVGTAAATFFFFGRFVILGGATHTNAGAGSLDAETLTLMVFTMDVMTASLLAFHAGVLWRLPFVGSRMRNLAEEGRNLTSNVPWVRRATFAAIVLFVMFPLASTGSVGGSIFGRLLGMGRVRSFVAVVVGSLLGCAVMYFGSSLIDRYLDRSNPIVQYGGLAAVVAAILILMSRFRRLTTPPPDADA